MQKNIWKIKSFNFVGWDASRTSIEAAKEQIDAMVDKCSVNTVTIAVGARQEHCYSTDIDWKGPHMLEDEQLAELIRYSHDKNLKVIMKPMLNTQDGYWRAFIRFFDEDVPCEPKWSDWFRNYTEYIVHFAKLCEKEAADMLKLESAEDNPQLNIILPAVDDYIKTATGKDWSKDNPIDPIAKLVACVLLVRWFEDPGMIGKATDAGVIGLIGQLHAKALEVQV
jgi:hypothetical protein